MQLTESTNCKICGFGAAGIHFGVRSCRACAAFFRRSFKSNRDYACVLDKHRCDPDFYVRNACRLCRYHKCIRLGMTSRNLEMGHSQLNKEQRMKRNKDIISRKAEKKSNSRSEDTPLYTLEIIVSMVLIPDEPPIRYGHFATLSPLQKFVEGLRLLRKSQQTDDIKFKNRLTREQLISHWTKQSKNTAKLFMHFSIFRELFYTEQCKMFRAIWQSVHRLERIQMSTEAFGKKCVSEKKIVISCGCAIQLDDLCFKLPGIPKMKKQLMLRDYKRFARRLIENVARPLEELKLSIEELAFLILNFILSNEDPIFSKHLKNCDEFRDSIANSLHEHYQKVGIVNNASRIMKLMKIVDAMNRIHHDDRAGEFTKNFKIYQV